jgi:uncharacterized RDD family membrane protein YckC
MIDNKNVIGNDYIDRREKTGKESDVGPVEIKAPYPWRRYFARMLDLSIYGLPWIMLCRFVFRWQAESSISNTFINLLVPWLVVLLLEPVLLSKFGTTIGKWIFGITLSDMNGDKITYENALYRTFGVFGIGVGYSIPLYNFYRLYKSYDTCQNNRLLEWDEGINYRLKDKKKIRIVGIVIVNILVILLVIVIELQAQMPINRGDLTPEEYYENCNDFMKYNKIDYGKILNKNGEWIVSPTSNENTIYFSNKKFPRYSVTLSNGVLTSVKIEVEVNDSIDGWVEGYGNHFMIATMSFVAAQNDMNFIDLYKSNFLHKLGNGFENFSFEEAGVQITNSVEYSGFDMVPNGYLIPKDEEEQYIHMIFMLEKL